MKDRYIFSSRYSPDPRPNAPMLRINTDSPTPVKEHRIRFIFRWYDIWIGLFIDRPNKRVYFFPIPMFGCVISWRLK